MTAESHRSKPRIALTMGDPNGIGPEIAVVAASALGAELDILLVGERHVFEAHARTRGVSIDGLTISEEAADDFVLASTGSSRSSSDVAPEFGRISADAGRRSMEAVQIAVSMCLNGEVDAMVTAPISKEAIAKAGYPFPGHTEFIAHLCQSDNELMLMVADSLRVALATVHIPLANVTKTLTSALVGARLTTLIESLQRDFGIEHPRIATLGLNPHAGDGGVIGTEEVEILQPAMKAVGGLGAAIAGPFPADGFFGNRTYESYDAVLAMYHDQGLIPFKTLSFNRGCNFTAGVPIVRVSPDHGTAFDIAGKGVASAASLMQAMRVAATIARARVDSAGTDGGPTYEERP